MKLYNLESTNEVFESMKKLYSAKKLCFEVIGNKSITQILEDCGEYYAKVCNGQKYFEDYDCFVENICEEKFELVYGPSNLFSSNVCHVQSKRRLS